MEAKLRYRENILVVYNRRPVNVLVRNSCIKMEQHFQFMVGLLSFSREQNRSARSTQMTASVLHTRSTHNGLSFSFCLR